MSYKDSKILFNKRECIVHKDKNNNLFIKSSGKQIDVNKLFHKNKQVLKKQYEKFRIKKKVNGGLLYENLNDKFNDLYLNYANSLKNHIFDNNSTQTKLIENFVPALTNFNDNKEYNIAFDVLILKKIYTYDSKDIESYISNFDDKSVGKKKIVEDLIKIKQDLLIAFLNGFKNENSDFTKLINNIIKEQYDELINNIDDYNTIFAKHCEKYNVLNGNTEEYMKYQAGIIVKSSAQNDIVVPKDTVDPDVTAAAVTAAVDAVDATVDAAVAEAKTAVAEAKDALIQTNAANHAILSATSNAGDPTKAANVDKTYPTALGKAKTAVTAVTAAFTKANDATADPSNNDDAQAFRKATNTAYDAARENLKTLVNIKSVYDAFKTAKADPDVTAAAVTEANQNVATAYTKAKQAHNAMNTAINNLDNLINKFPAVDAAVDAATGGGRKKLNNKKTQNTNHKS